MARRSEREILPSQIIIGAGHQRDRISDYRLCLCVCVTVWIIFQCGTFKGFVSFFCFSFGSRHALPTLLCPSLLLLRYAPMIATLKGDLFTAQHGPECVFVCVCVRAALCSEFIFLFLLLQTRRWCRCCSYIEPPYSDDCLCCTCASR